jgi:hypothetical protein
MRGFLRTLLLIGPLAVVIGCAPAVAQVGKNPSLQKPDPGAENQAPKLPPSDENLSRRLDRNDGVIKPPGGVDPEMHIAPKDPNAGGSMPVIPPPNGKGQVQPK